MVQCLIDVTTRTGIPVTILYLAGWNTHVDQLHDGASIGKASKHQWMLANRNMVLFLMR